MCAFPPHFPISNIDGWWHYSRTFICHTITKCALRMYVCLLYLWYGWHATVVHIRMNSQSNVDKTWMERFSMNEWWILHANRWCAKKHCFVKWNFDRTLNFWKLFKCIIRFCLNEIKRLSFFAYSELNRSFWRHFEHISFVCKIVLFYQNLWGFKWFLQAFYDSVAFEWRKKKPKSIIWNGEMSGAKYWKDGKIDI